MSAVRDLIRRRPVVAYVALAWALSWAVWIPMALGGVIVRPGGNVSHFPGLIGPMLAALIVIAVAEGGSGLRDFASAMVRWRVPVRWYLAAALPFLMFLATVAFLAASGAETPALADLGKFSGLPTVAWPLVLLFVLAFNGYGEEAGWRGFLTPRLLRRHGKMTTSLIVAAVWFTWHVPSFWVIETYRELGLAIIPMMGIGLVSGAIVLTWLYIGSGGSVWIVVLWHVALNFSSATLAGRGVPGVVVWNGILLWAIVAAVSWMLAPEPRSRPLPSRLRDGMLIAVLRSPLGRLFGGMTVVTFRARRTGRTLMTPVECVREAGHVYVLVGQPGQKQWWRNVRANPEISIEVAGHDVPAHATVHVGDDPGAREDLAIYLEHRPRAARAMGLDAGDAMNEASLAGVAAKAVSVRIDFQPMRAT